MLGLPMTRRQRLRRVGILCCHFLRNLAFYKSGWRKGKLIFKDQFWVNANGNFIDICVLEWCKLFGEKRGQHYWRKVVTDQTAFFAELLRAVGQTEAEFDAYIEEMRTYRDKFVAHLDSAEVMNIPTLRTARKSVSFLYGYLLANEEEDNCFHDAPPEASRFYRLFYSQGRKVYSR
jgi:hypothetical protein